VQESRSFFEKRTKKLPPLVPRRPPGPYDIPIGARFPPHRIAMPYDDIAMGNLAGKSTLFDLLMIACIAVAVLGPIAFAALCRRV
jgi:hypothetical protein